MNALILIVLVRHVLLGRMGWGGVPNDPLHNHLNRGNLQSWSLALLFVIFSLLNELAHQSGGGGYSFTQAVSVTLIKHNQSETI